MIRYPVVTNRNLHALTVLLKMLKLAPRRHLFAGAQRLDGYQTKQSWYSDDTNVLIGACPRHFLFTDSVRFCEESHRLTL